MSKTAWKVKWWLSVIAAIFGTCVGNIVIILIAVFFMGYLIKKTSGQLTL